VLVCLPAVGYILSQRQDVLASETETFTYDFLDRLTGVSGPYWKDRNFDHWARAAGDNGGPADIVMRFYYAVQPSFFFFPTNPPPVGAT
jgi:hypothetical protein